MPDIIITMKSDDKGMKTPSRHLHILLERQLEEENVLLRSFIARLSRNYRSQDMAISRSVLGRGVGGNSVLIMPGKDQRSG